MREEGLTYSRFISGLAEAGIELDRKVMADIAVHEPAAFKGLVAQAQAALRENSVVSSLACGRLAAKRPEGAQPRECLQAQRRTAPQSARFAV